MFAYGFIPLTEGARPSVSFMGTAQPTATGALYTYFFDFISFLGIGEGSYLTAKKRFKINFLKIVNMEFLKYKG